MKELAEINQTIIELCSIFDKKIKDDRLHEANMKEIDEAINQIKANHAKIKNLL